ncbi:sialin-like [Rhopilema esculentum]|uniref:sialin-like n=1 Tax=Rhopilema esculentum TaxID=499914 RepID=UPI0031E1289D
MDLRHDQASVAADVVESHETVGGESIDRKKSPSSSPKTLKEAHLPNKEDGTEQNKDVEEHVVMDKDEKNIESERTNSGPVAKVESNKMEDDQESTSHSEDKVILFDPVSHVHEMQLKATDEHSTEMPFKKKCSTCMHKRNLIALLSFFGFFIVYCLRVDLSITLVAMTNQHTRVTLMGDEWTAEPEFDWDNKLQGNILGAFFYGYLITQIPGGYIAARFGGKNLFGLAIIMTSFLTLLTPWASRQHVALLITLRFLEGICEGCIYPCMYAIWSKWAPPMERSKLSTVPHAGSYAGSVAGTLVSGILCELAGWSIVFYIFGALGIIWSFIWFLVVVDAPSLDPTISDEERTYIEDSLKDDRVSQKVLKPPWMKFMTSVPFLAILIAHTCEGWGFSTMQTCLPKYLTEALGMRIVVAGVYSAILYFMMGVVVLCGGQLADFARLHGTISTTNIRKLFTCLGFLLQALAFSASVNFANIHASVIVLVVGGGIEGLAWAGFAVNHLDIAPRYASILFGITNTSATIPGILSPLVVGYITQDKTKAEWHLVFYIGAATFAVGATVYGLFASAEKQEWADYDGDADYKIISDEERE